jgi:HEAT repeat protein
LPEKEDAARRRSVAQLLGAARQDANSLLPAVLNSMENDPDRGVRTACLLAVVKMTPEPGKDVAGAIARLAGNDKDANVRKQAIIRLGQLGPQAGGQTAAILAALSDPEDTVRVAAARSLVMIGKSALPGLLQALESDDAVMRALAASALGRMGTAAKSALPALEKLKADPQTAVQQAAQIAIRRISGR